MLNILRKIVESVSSAESLTTSMNNLVMKIKEALGVDCCSVYVKDQQTNQLKLVATDGLKPHAVGNVILSIDEGVVGLVARKLELINLAEAKESPFYKNIPGFGDEQFHSFLGVPIVDQGLLLGVLTIQQKTSRKFDEMDESFMVMLATQLAGKFLHAKLKKEKAIYDQNYSKTIVGLPVSKGLAQANAFVIRPPLLLENVEIKKSEDPTIQYELFHQAMLQVQLELDHLMLKLNQSSNATSCQIFEVYNMILNDHSFVDAIDREIMENGLQATSAVKIICEQYIDKFNNLEDAYLKERAADVKDVAQRLLAKLAHGQVEFYDFSKPIILVAEEVTASLLVEIPKASLKGVISHKGSANSHAAILARNMGIPAIMAISDPIDQFDNRYIVMDGTTGNIIIDPDNAVKAEYEQLIENEKNLIQVAEQELYDSVITLDQQKITIELNAGLNLDLEKSKGNFVDGVGLYRTEIPFMLQDRVLTEQEQITNYRDFLVSFKDLPVCMRTLDVGGDKPLSYLKISEMNPALGWRGVRLTLDNRPLFMTQLKAMLKANIGLGNLSIMIPMISSSKEILETKELLDLAYSEVKEQLGLSNEQLIYPKLGAMIEIPAAIMLIEDLSKVTDFFSVGTNDLTQYILAVDRNNPKVAHCYDPYHPAIIKSLEYIYRECNRLNKPVSICGEMAGDSLGILILLAIGYRTFSMNLSSIAKIKYLLRRIDISKVKAIIDHAGLINIDQIKNDLKSYLEEQDLLKFLQLSSSAKIGV